VVVRSGDDSMIDIRYRGEPGHVISGTIKLSGSNGASVALAPVGSTGIIANAFQGPESRGFAINGIADGEYELVAQESNSAVGSLIPAFAISEPKRVTVKGADVNGIELVTRALSSISGKISLESSKVPECQGKRAPLFTETLIRLQRPEKAADKADLLQARTFTSTASPDASGAFALRNLIPGKYQFEPVFYARYWYLQSITTSAGATKPQKTDEAANWTMLKAGDQVSNLMITLAQGAASIRGRVPAPEGAATPGATAVYLVPAEPDKTDDVLRYFVSGVGEDQTFAFNNLPPGKYLVLTDSQASTLAKLRQPEAGTTRATIRRRAEAKKNAIELKPCQNLTDYQVKQ
jgi:hypothetical protein